MFYTQKLVKQLQQFGLSDKEAAIYLASLQLGSATVQDISKKSDLNRSTVHILINRLRKKGFLGTTRNKNKRLIFAESPEKLKEIVDQEKFQVEMKEMSLTGLLPILENFNPHQQGKPKVSFYEGERGFFDLCERSLQKAKDEMFFISSMRDFYDVTTQKYDDEHYIPTRVKKGIKIYALLFRNKRTEWMKKVQKDYLREVRFLPEKYRFKSSIFIYGDEFSLCSSKMPFLGVVVQSEELTHTMLQMFKLMWDSCK